MPDQNGMNIPEDKPTDPSALIRLATVASVDLESGFCTVQLDDDSESGPVRWLERRAGATRSWSPPSIDEQVVLLCPDGELAGAVVLGAVSSEIFPPSGNDLTENMVFEDGAVISYDPEAHILTANLPGGSEINVTADTIKIIGDVEIDGTIDATGIIASQDDVTAGDISLKDHLHGNVQAGSAKTGAPE